MIDKTTMWRCPDCGGLLCDSILVHDRRSNLEFERCPYWTTEGVPCWAIQRYYSKIE